MSVKLILTHGAGAGMNSEFMRALLHVFDSLEIDVIPFNFTYMEEMIKSGKRRPPPKLSNLEQELLAIIDKQDSTSSIFVAGKSMGGRVATQVLEQSKALGAFCFGYPFHPINHPDRVRTEHLKDIKKPVVIFQGTRDRFGLPDEVKSYALCANVLVNWLDDADHDFKGGGISPLQRIESAAKFAVNLMQSQL